MLPWFLCAHQSSAGADKEVFESKIMTFKPDIRYWSYHDSCLLVADISVAFISIAAFPFPSTETLKSGDVVVSVHCTICVLLCYVVSFTASILQSCENEAPMNRLD